MTVLKRPASRSVPSSANTAWYGQPILGGFVVAGRLGQLSRNCRGGPGKLLQDSLRSSDQSWTDSIPSSSAIDPRM